MTTGDRADVLRRQYLQSLAGAEVQKRKDELCAAIDADKRGAARSERLAAASRALGLHDANYDKPMVHKNKQVAPTASAGPMSSSMHGRQEELTSVRNKMRLRAEQAGLLNGSVTDSSAAAEVASKTFQQNSIGRFPAQFTNAPDPERTRLADARKSLKERATELDSILSGQNSALPNRQTAGVSAVTRSHWPGMGLARQSNPASPKPAPTQSPAKTGRTDTASIFSSLGCSNDSLARFVSEASAAAIHGPGRLEQLRHEGAHIRSHAAKLSSSLVREVPEAPKMINEELPTRINEDYEVNSAVQDQYVGDAAASEHEPGAGHKEIRGGVDVTKQPATDKPKPARRKWISWIRQPAR